MPNKTSRAFSNLVQEPNGKIRSFTEIVAEKGVDTVGSTIGIVLGDGVDLESSGPQVIARSQVTGTRYQIPYQSIDKAGSGNIFSVTAQAETFEVSQPVFDTQLTSPLRVTTPTTNNEIINSIYFKTDGDINNFRMQIKSVATGEVILSYPNKFEFNKDAGLDLMGAGDHTINMYYTNSATPTRLLQGDVFEIYVLWDDSPGTILGTSIAPLSATIISGGGFPYYAIDHQIFELEDLVLEAPIDGTQYARKDGDWLPIVTSIGVPVLGSKLAVQAYQFSDITGISSNMNIIWSNNVINPDGAYNPSTGRVTIPQSWIDDYDYMTIMMSVRAGWNGSDTKMTQISMYYNNGSTDLLYQRDGHSKLKSGESIYNLLMLMTPKLDLSNYTAGDYFYAAWENGAPFADMLGGHDNFIQIELFKTIML